jgi:hypothetical protein
MAHFAKVVNGLVTQVIVAEPEFFETFVDTSPGQWIQTSCNTTGGIHYDPNTRLPDGGLALRKNFAGIGYTYNASLDAFIAPKPFASWILDEETCQWQAPSDKPDDGKFYAWDESNLQWVEVEQI